ncbi:MAG: CHRD domain-containing protein [Deltaproteobacteria bacterium]
MLILFYITYQNAVGFKEINQSISQNLEIAIDDDYFYPNISDNDNINQGTNTHNTNGYGDDLNINNNNNNNQQSFSYLKYKNNYLEDYVYNNQNKYKNEFIVQLDPYQIVSDKRDYYPDSSGIVYLSVDSSSKELSFKVFLEGMSYEEGDDVEIIQIHLGTPGENGPTVLSLCNEKKGKGHCREGPGLSVEGVLEEKDLKGPLKNSSFSELIKVFEHGQSYVYVQSRDHPEGEIRGQVSY